jgi:hypothetical protein
MRFKENPNFQPEKPDIKTRANLLDKYIKERTGNNIPGSQTPQTRRESSTDEGDIW